jgi:hypothetical protein
MTPGGGAVLYGERRNGPASAIATLLGRASSSVGGEELRRHDRNRYDGDVAHTRANLVPGVRDAGWRCLCSARPGRVSVCGCFETTARAAAEGWSRLAQRGDFGAVVSENGGAVTTRCDPDA